MSGIVGTMAALPVSKLCFGTMTFGEQNSYEEACTLLNLATDSGINFFDVAEMYPVPQQMKTHGRSEVYLGKWMKQAQMPRDRLVVATKAAGPSGQMTWIRGGPVSLDAKNIEEAINGSLTRLGCDYIDLYQLHWPDRCGMVLLYLSFSNVSSASLR
jgi:aryl-alcohol dehydrogenase-like predicted oxidoreductase